MIDSGRSMPVNAEPAPNGNVEVFPVDGNPRRGRVVSGGFFESEANPESTFHVPHFASCPNADGHRKSR